MKKPSEDTQKRAKKTVEEFIRMAGAVRDKHLGAVAEWNKHYAVEQSERMYQGRANTADSSSHENVETIVPRMYNIVTESGKLNFGVSPVGSEDEPLADAINAVVKSDLKMAGSRKKVINSVRDVVKYGTLVTEVPWKQYTRTRNFPRYKDSVDGVDEDGNITSVERVFLGYEKTDEVVYEGTNWNIIDLKSAWLDPIEADVNKASGIAIEKVVYFDDLEKERLRGDVSQQVTQDGLTAIRVKSTKGHYFNLEELKKKLDPQVKKTASGDEISKDQLKDTPRPQVNIKTYWGWFDYADDGKAVDCIITLANADAGTSGIIIRCEPSTYPSRPFIVTRYIAVTGQTYGLGVLGLMSPIQKMINDMQNQAMDDATQSLLPMWKRLADSELQDKDTEFGQNKVLVVDHMDEIEQIEHKPLLRAAWEAIQYARDNATAATGAYKTLKAEPIPGDTTATEVNTQQTEATARIILSSIFFEEEFIVPLITLTIEQNQEFMGPEKVLRLTDDEKAAGAIQAVTFKDIAGQVDITPLGASKHVRQMKKRQEWQEYAMAITPVLTIPQDLAHAYDINIPLWLKKIGEPFDLEDLDKIFPMTQLPNELPQAPEGGGGEPDPIAAFMGAGSEEM